MMQILTGEGQILAGEHRILTAEVFPFPVILSKVEEPALSEAERDHQKKFF